MYLQLPFASAFVSKYLHISKRYIASSPPPPPNISGKYVYRKTLYALAPDLVYTLLLIISFIHAKRKKKKTKKIYIDQNIIIRGKYHAFLQQYLSPHCQEYKMGKPDPLRLHQFSAIVKDPASSKSTLGQGHQGGIGG